MKQIGRIASLATLLLSLLAGLAAAKDAKLVFAPEGKTLHYTIDAQQEMNVGFQYETNHKGDLEMVWMEKTKDGNSKLSVTFKNIEGTAKMGDDLQDAPLGINGIEVWVVVSPRGEILESDPQKTISQQDQMLLKQIIETLVPYFPEDKVGDGDSWIKDRNKDSTEEDGQKTEGEYEYFLDGFKKSNGMELAKIVGEGEVKITNQTPSGPVTGDAKGSQEFEVALDGGYPLKTRSTVDFNGNMGSQKISVVFRIECHLKQ